eukprot:COSAG02_NODE_35998_length_460_cov_0.991690_1_plen_67_part_00
MQSICTLYRIVEFTIVLVLDLTIRVYNSLSVIQGFFPGNFHADFSYLGYSILTSTRILLDLASTSC